MCNNTNLLYQNHFASVQRSLNDNILEVSNQFTGTLIKQLFLTFLLRPITILVVFQNLFIWKTHFGERRAGV